MRIGIDLGGTKTEVIALGDAGEQLYRHRLPTPRDDYRQTIETIATLVDMAEQATGQRGTQVWAFLAQFRLTPVWLRMPIQPRSTVSHSIKT